MMEIIVEAGLTYTFLALTASAAYVGVATYASRKIHDVDVMIIGSAATLFLGAGAASSFVALLNL